MADRLTTEQRSLNMAAIRGRNTSPEIQVRKLLHRLGYRFRLHDRRLPGTPDIVLRRFRTVVMVHGCFWHLHGCSRSKIPGTRRTFWVAKLEGNRARDQRQEEELKTAGWKVVVVWECETEVPELLIRRFTAKMPK